jgi:hypothetical protein
MRKYFLEEMYIEKVLQNRAKSGILEFLNFI